MNFLESDATEVTKANYPQLIQQSLDNLNNSYEELEVQQSQLENRLKTSLNLKNRSQLLTQIKKDAENLQISNLEQISANYQKLIKLSNDPLQNLQENQIAELQVIISRYRQLIPAKKQELQQFKNTANKAQTQYEEQEAPINQQQQEKQRLVDIQLTEKEEKLSRDQKDINEIAQDVDDVLNIIGNITNEVQNQKLIVDKIDIVATGADEEMDRGVEELLNAEKKQKSGKKFRCAAIVTSVIAVLVLVIVLLFVFI